jgi:hypothetical protein
MSVRQEIGYEAIEDPFETLPDGLDDPYMLLLAFSRLVHSDYAKPSDAKLVGAVTRARAAVALVRAAFINQIARAVGRRARK